MLNFYLCRLLLLEIIYGGRWHIDLFFNFLHVHVEIVPKHESIIFPWNASALTKSPEYAAESFSICDVST